MAKQSLNEATLEGLLYQALETEQDGIRVYETALTCAQNSDLRQEWSHCLEEKRRHENVLLRVIDTLGLAPAARAHGPDITTGIDTALIGSMNEARATLTEDRAELVACEAVVLAETQDHLNWELLAHVLRTGSHPHHAVLRAAVEIVETDDPHRLQHTKRWCHESWSETLGLPAAVPAAEARRHALSALGPGRAAPARERLG